MYTIEEAISSLQLLAAALRLEPDGRTQSGYSGLAHIPIVAAVLGAVAVAVLSMPIPVPSSIQSYLFFIVHCITIFREYTEAEASGSGSVRFWHSGIVICALVVVSFALFSASRSNMYDPDNELLKSNEQENFVGNPSPLDEAS